MLETPARWFVKAAAGNANPALPKQGCTSHQHSHYYQFCCCGRQQWTVAAGCNTSRKTCADDNVSTDIMIPCTCSCHHPQCRHPSSLQHCNCHIFDDTKGLELPHRHAKHVPRWEVHNLDRPKASICRYTISTTAAATHRWAEFTQIFVCSYSHCRTANISCVLVLHWHRKKIAMHRLYILHFNTLQYYNLLPYMW